MTAERSVWDYSGIVAAAYDHFFGAEPYWDQTFFEDRLRASGARALEVACGTGRLLLPLLRDGLQVEGLDTSHEMLDRLRAKAAALNLAPVVHQMPMQDFALPRRYRTVFVPACTFQILVDDSEIRAALACCLAALEPGGEVLIPIGAYDDDPQPIIDWRERRNVYVAEHAAQVVICERSEFTADGRLQHWRLRYEVERPGQAKDVFYREHGLRRYRPDEFRALLEAAGYEGIAVRRGYTEPQSSDPTDDLVFSARRPSGR